MADSVSLAILEKELGTTSNKIKTTEEAVEFHEEERFRLKIELDFYNEKYADLKSAIDKLKS